MITKERIEEIIKATQKSPHKRYWLMNGKKIARELLMSLMQFIPDLKNIKDN